MDAGEAGGALVVAFQQGDHALVELVQVPVLLVLLGDQQVQVTVLPVVLGQVVADLLLDLYIAEHWHVQVAVVRDLEAGLVLVGGEVCIWSTVLTSDVIFF